MFGAAAFLLLLDRNAYAPFCFLPLGGTSPVFPRSFVPLGGRR